jgi:hypothetical protein
MRATLALALAAGWLLCAAPALAQSAEETFVYVVQPGDTCTSLTQRFYGSTRYQIVLKYNKLGPPPHHLSPGQALILPRPDWMREDDRADARVSHRQGPVKARPPQEEQWKDAQRGLDLFRAWRVNTLEDAFAQLTFRDRSTFSMREDTLVVIFGGTSSQLRRQKTRAELERGTLRHHMDALAGDTGGVELVTPSAEAELDQGSALISVEAASGTTRVANHSGQDALVFGRDKEGKRQKKAVKLPQNMGSKVEVGQAPTPPRPLPPAPSWEGGGALAAVTFAPRLPVARALWTPVPEARQYLVELSRDARGQEVYQAALASGDQHGAELRDLEPGIWWLRVASIDADAFEGRPSSPARLVIGALSLYDPLERLWRGDEPEGAAPAWAWSGSALHAPPGGACQREGHGEPAPILPLTAPGVAQIRCKTIDGDALPTLQIEVRPITARLVTEALPDALPRNERLLIPVELPDGAAPYLRAEASTGIITWPLAQRDGQWVQEILIPESAPSPLQLTLQAIGQPPEVATLSTLSRDAAAPTQGALAQQAPAPEGDPRGALRPHLDLWMGGAWHQVGASLGVARPAFQASPGLRLGLEMGDHFALEAEGRGGLFGLDRLDPDSGQDGIAGLLGYRLGALILLDAGGLRPFLSVGRGTDWLLRPPSGYTGDRNLQLTYIGLGVKVTLESQLNLRLELRQSLTQGRLNALGTATEAALSAGWSF